MNSLNISVNLESLQDRMNGTKEIVESLQLLKKAGFEYVEVLHAQNPDDGLTWREILDNIGLKASSTHELFDDIKKNPEQIIKKAKDLGCKYIVAGLAQSTVWEDPESVKKLVEELNTLNKEISKAGLQLLYHNHNMEFAKPFENQNALRYIIDNTDPSIGFEIDCYWLQLSGVNPAEYFRYIGNRLKTIHLKDLAVTGGTYEKYIKTPTPAALGAGNMDFKGICKAAMDAGCEWFIIETHTNWIDGDSIKTAAMSLDYLKALDI